MSQSVAYAMGRDGSPIYYRVRGAPTCPAIILSDGIGCAGYIWKYLEDPLVEAGWRVIHWNYRGHGRTPFPLDPERVAISDLADDAAAILDAVGTERAVLAGHSMGVQVSLETFRRHRDRVLGLVLMCGSYGTPLRTFRGNGTLEATLPLMRVVAHAAPRMVRALWRSLLPTEISFQVAKAVEINPELVRRDDFFPYLEGISRVDPLLFLKMLTFAGRHSAREVLPQIDLPTLVLAGDRDSFTPVALSKEMAELIAGSELVIVTGGSHTAPIERPEIVRDAILDFLRRRVEPDARKRTTKRRATKQDA